MGREGKWKQNWSQSGTKRQANSRLREGKKKKKRKKTSRTLLAIAVHFLGYDTNGRKLKEKRAGRKGSFGLEKKIDGEVHS